MGNYQVKENRIAEAFADCVRELKRFNTQVTHGPKFVKATDRAWFTIRDAQKLAKKFAAIQSGVFPPGFGYQPLPTGKTPKHPPRKP